ncbi:MAG: glycosyltransferase family 4 protein [Bacteroidia bacterium]
MKVLFLVPYPVGEAASQRFRFEQYFDLLRANDIDFKISPFLDKKAWDILYLKGHFFQKFAAIVRGKMRRLSDLFSMGKYDYVFVHREVFPIGPPIFEFLITKILRKKVIFDFDDAIWIPNHSDHNRFMFFLKRFGNVTTLIKWAYKVSCGNEYLADYSRQFNDNVVYNPTTIDTENYHNQVKNQDSENFVIGWTGSHSTLQYLNDLVPVLKNLETEYDFQLHVISDRSPDFQLNSLVWKKWKKETEIEDLLQFNVGLMPLTVDKWSEGKCGFKALQYMALGIPAIVSPVGVNCKVVDHGVNGFVCSSPEEWENTLALLMTDRKHPKEISTATRQKIVNHYSVHSNAENFLKLFS